MASNLAVDIDPVEGLCQFLRVRFVEPFKALVKGSKLPTDAFIALIHSVDPKTLKDSLSRWTSSSSSAESEIVRAAKQALSLAV